MTNGLWKGSLLVLIISLYWKKRIFKRAHQQIQILMFGLAQRSHLGLWYIIPPPPPPESKLAFHIYYVKYENTFMKIGNKMQNHKIEPDCELIYEDGSILSTLIFIKIIGSDTLWFPLPPSEVLWGFLNAHESGSNSPGTGTFSRDLTKTKSQQCRDHLPGLCIWKNQYPRPSGGGGVVAWLQMTSALFSCRKNNKK